MAQGYCTLEDLRSAFQEEDMPAEIQQDKRIATDAIASQTEPLEKELKRHWYSPTGSDMQTEAVDIDVPDSTKTRDDEESIPTGAAHVVGDPASPKLTQGEYTHVDLARRDADSLSALHVRMPDGSFEDWVGGSDYSEGSWPPSGEDYYLRVNNGGWSRLYLDTSHFRDDDGEWAMDSYSNAVYLEWSYGHGGIPSNVRRAVALRAAAEFVDEAAVQIPDNARVRTVESLAEKFETRADELLEAYR